ncbi:hypothetical protein Aph02nite_42690 [Actinoplanes philippinensis]|uniref:LPXTG-motif cell wall anchor domain-containing protein n=1 Tax=Actinoplanes philippinensis TaxID=35752 RepID=A0A1I2H0X8_9ACTN|nr:hypothetical protein [Actinoplanes philippinensis]GIE78319.1 hypothetical protein Aph02nite_42690 [Actinoplanes philippinensis]SFF23735.1 hypothetical protein SAMN05421541_107399 [Actinoplanes philippinensis]
MRGWRRSAPAAILAAVLLLLTTPVTTTPALAGAKCPIFDEEPFDLDSLKPGAVVDPFPDKRFDYFFFAPAMDLADLPEPAPEVLDAITEVEDYKLKKGLGAVNPKELRTNRLYAYWKRHQETDGSLTWEQYRDMYVGNQGKPNQGNAFDQEIIKAFRLGGDKGWVCQEKVTAPGFDKKRVYDVFRKKGRPISIEGKSGEEKFVQEQVDKDKAIKKADTRPAGQEILQIQVVADMPSEEDLETLTEANIVVVLLRATGTPVLPGSDPPGNAAAATEPTGPEDGGSGQVFTTPDQAPSTGTAVTAIATSPATRAEAEQLRKARAEFAGEWDDPDDMPDETGGIDFSTLELRYIADPVDGDAGLKYSFSAKPTADGQLSWGGLAAAQQASDAFFVWMALRPEHFWVNLNPNEPDRIIEERLGTTDAGRVLLEADLQMKKTVAKLIHPDSAGGRRFWDALRNTDDEQTCLSFRQWIVPDTATVHEQDGGLYIVDAPLIVKSETEYFDSGDAAEGAAAGCKPGDEATEKHNAEVFRSQILVKVQEAVNTAPEYAELRRVYLSRVAAEWYRQRSTNHNTAFAGVVNSGDVSRWPSRTGWTPREVFDRYVKSYTDGEFNVTHRTTTGNVVETRTYIYGGVDFSRSPRSDVGAAALGGLPSTVANSLGGTVEDGGQIWLGGVSADRPAVPFKVTSLLTWLAGAVMALLVAALFVRSLWRQQRRRREWNAARR